MKKHSIKDVLFGKVPVVVVDLDNNYAPLPPARFHDFIRHAHRTATLEMHQSVGSRIPGRPTVYSWVLIHAIGTAPDGARMMATWEPGTADVSMKRLDDDMLDFVREETAAREAEEKALLEPVRVPA